MKTLSLPKPSPLFLSLSLLLLTLAVFAQTLGFDFVDVDDPSYVVDNDRVLDGLRPDSIRWAWTSSTLGHWHPMTFMSYMLDASLFGTGPAGFHFTNAALHTANVLLLFALLLTTTGAPWRSAFVAAAFAIHPARAESVAWIAERKDVLSAFFALLALLSFARWVKTKRIAFYGLALACFFLAGASKAIVATLPCLLLLLDLWPLERFQAKGAASWKIAADWLRLVPEKLPFFAVSAGVSYAAIWASANDSAFRTLDELSFGYRISNAAVAYATYVKMLVWPAGLGAFYPHLGDALPSATVAASAALLLACTCFACVFARSRPYLFVGWFWFLGLIVPVSGLFQVGDQAMADRYTYLSTVGLFICAAWMLAELAEKRPSARTALAAGCAALVAIYAGAGWRQTRLWRGTIPLYEHTLRVTPENAFVYQVLGNAYMVAGRYEDAEAQFSLALELHPGQPGWMNKLGKASFFQGRYEEAEAQFLRLVEIDPSFPDTYNNLGLVNLEMKRFDRAAGYFSEAARRMPLHAEPQLNWGTALAALGDRDAARPHFRRAAELDPERPEPHFNLGAAALEEGRYEDAADHLRRAVELDPSRAAAHASLARAYRALGRTSDAERHEADAGRADGFEPR